MIPTIRTTNEYDHATIQSMIQKIKNNSKPWFKYIDWNKCFDQFIKNGLVVQETYLVLMIIDIPWFMAKPAVTELFVGKLYHTGYGSFKDVTDALVGLGKQHGATTVLSGSLLVQRPQAMARLYQRYGFTFEGVQMIKEIT